MKYEYVKYLVGIHLCIKVQYDKGWLVAVAVK